MFSLAACFIQHFSPLRSFPILHVFFFSWATAPFLTFSSCWTSGLARAEQRTHLSLFLVMVVN